MQGYDQEICQTRFFVGLRIKVDAPGVLAALRPWSDLSWKQSKTLVNTHYHAMHTLPNLHFYRLVQKLRQNNPFRRIVDSCHHGFSSREVGWGSSFFLFHNSSIFFSIIFYHRGFFRFLTSEFLGEIFSFGLAD